MPFATATPRSIPILDATRRWQCPSCGYTHITNEPRAHVPMHPCKSMDGLIAPMVEVTTRSGELDLHQVRLVRVDRDDYVGDEIVRTDAAGRPAMAVITERADGSNDCHVFAATASATGTA